MMKRFVSRVKKNKEITTRFINKEIKSGKKYFYTEHQPRVIQFFNIISLMEKNYFAAEKPR